VEFGILHTVCGVAVLILARTVWGFVGPQYSRFSDFMYGPQTILPFIADTLRMRAPRYIGHNPAGGAMAITLLVTLMMLCITGIIMTTDAFWEGKWVDDLHSISSNLSLILISFHLAGVIIASLEHKENLILAMITGWKRPL
jgi:cytochrome b